MATGLAKGAAAAGHRIAFGDGRKIIWGPHSAEIFRGNPNIAPPGQEKQRGLRWIEYHKGNRIYNRPGERRWIWNYEFKARPGEFFWSEEERAFAEGIKPEFVLLEPNLPWHKHVAVNKDWGLDRWQQLADRLRAAGFRVAQFACGKRRLFGVETISSPSFRMAAAALTRARLAVLPEGGLHHAAAAVGTKAIVIFGGFIPPEVVGYREQISLIGNSTRACGLHTPCKHCRSALDSISVDQVFAHAGKI